MKLNHFIIALAVSAGITACSSGKTVLPYFTDLPNDGVVATGDFTVKIVPDDELLINVSAADPAAVEDYTIPYQHPRVRDFNTSNSVTPESYGLSRRAQNLALQTYHVDRQGFINFPVLGKLHVGGMTLNGLAVLGVLLNVAIAVAIYLWGNIKDVSVLVGIMSGAVTNTPGLAAAQQAISQTANGAEAANLMASGYAAAYPLGVVGIIVAMFVVKGIFRINTTDELTLGGRTFPKKP